MELGSHGIVVAVLFIVKKSVICVRRELAVLFGSVIVFLFQAFSTLVKQESNVLLKGVEI